MRRSQSPWTARLNAIALLVLLALLGHFVWQLRDCSVRGGILARPAFGVFHKCVAQLEEKP